MIVILTNIIIIIIMDLSPSHFSALGAEVNSRGASDLCCEARPILPARPVVATWCEAAVV